MLGTHSHTQIHNIFCCDLFIIKYFQEGMVNMMLLKFQFTTLASCEKDSENFYITINSNGSSIQ